MWRARLGTDHFFDALQRDFEIQRDVLHGIARPKAINDVFNSSAGGLNKRIAECNFGINNHSGYLELRELNPGGVPVLLGVSDQLQTLTDQIRELALARSRHFQISGSVAPQHFALIRPEQLRSKRKLKSPAPPDGVDAGANNAVPYARPPEPGEDEGFSEAEKRHGCLVTLSLKHRD